MRSRQKEPRLRSSTRQAWQRKECLETSNSSVSSLSKRCSRERSCFTVFTKMLFVQGQDESVAPQLECIESVCNLFTVIGKQLDEHSKYNKMIDVYFNDSKLALRSRTR